MKKQTFYFLAGAMVAVTACTSTDTTTDDTMTTTTETTTATDATGTTDTGTTGTTGTNLNMADLATLDDPTFVMAAASSNMFEIQAGNMAMQHAASQEVKDFGRMMVEHHTMANQELQTIASQMGVTLPTTLMPIHQALIDKINDKSGAEFNEDYMDTMETAHKMDIAMYEAKNNNVADPNLKVYVTKTLPILQTHHQSATAIEDKVD